jgi:hypothetical protein
MTGDSHGNRTWQAAIEERLTDEERADARRMRVWLVRGVVAVVVVLLLWIVAVIIGFAGGA